MFCPHCATPLDQATAFCPACGGSLAPAPAIVPAPPPDNVVYLQSAGAPAPAQQAEPGAAHGQLPGATEHAGHQQVPAATLPQDAPDPRTAQPAAQFVEAVTQPVQAPAPEPGAAPMAHADPRAGSYVNVLGETVQPSWYEPLVPTEPAVDREPRVVGMLAAMLGLGFYVVGVGWWALAMARNSPPAIAGGFVLLAMVGWVWYLTLPESEQLPRLSRRWIAFSARVDRRVLPLRSSAGYGMVLRRERERLQHMRRERARRIGELGEATYREFRHSGVPDSLVPQAQRVIAIEQQMLMQDARVGQLGRERDEVRERQRSAGRPGAASDDGSGATAPQRRRRRRRPRR